MSTSRKSPEELLALYGEPPSDQQKGRLKFLLLAFLVVFTCIFIRLAQLHLNPSLELTAEEKMHFGEVVLREPRGEIYDRNGLVLATNKEVPSLWVDPRAVQDSGLDKPELTLLMSARLGLSEEEVGEKISQVDEKGELKKFVWLKRWITDLSDEQLAEIEAKSGNAVQVQYEPLRFYPQADTAAHLLGFVNRNGEAAEGVEASFNKYLQSVPGKKIARKDARQRLLESQVYSIEEPKGGDLLQLTLDSSIQHNLEKTLDTRMVECKAPRAMGVVMDPQTGAILALACRPAFDPNRYDEFDPEARKNRALIDVFEPGSSFKIVTASAALEHGLVTTETMINCENGYFNPYGHTVRDFHPKGVIPFSECFAESSNIAMIKVGAMLGPERLEEWIRRYGFGSATSEDFPFESRGIFRGREKWSRLSMGSLPMGQEVSVTMLQLAKAFGVVANGGHLIEPYFVERAVSRYGETTYQHQHKQPMRILSPKTAATMQRLCQQVVLHGTGDDAAMDVYTAGGKTGTAQMVLPGGRGYDPDRFTAIFAGFAPATNPKLVCIIVVQEPMIDLHYGGFVSGPVFGKVVRDALVQLGVPPDQELPAEVKEKLRKEEEKKQKAKEKEKETLLLAQNAQAAAEAEKSVEPEADVDTVEPRLTMEEMEQSMDSLLEPLDGLELLTNANANDRQGELPDLAGLSKREAFARLSEINVPWDASGSGWVQSQNPPAGTPLRDVSMCKLEFSSPMAAAVVTNEQEQPL